MARHSCLLLALLAVAVLTARTALAEPEVLDQGTTEAPEDGTAVISAAQAEQSQAYGKTVGAFDPAAPNNPDPYADATVDGQQVASQAETEVLDDGTQEAADDESLQLESAQVAPDQASDSAVYHPADEQPADASTYDATTTAAAAEPEATDASSQLQDGEHAVEAEGEHASEPQQPQAQGGEEEEAETGPEYVEFEANPGTPPEDAAPVEPEEGSPEAKAAAQEEAAAAAGGEKLHPEAGTAQPEPAAPAPQPATQPAPESTPAPQPAPVASPTPAPQPAQPAAPAPEPAKPQQAASAPQAADPQVDQDASAAMPAPEAAGAAAAAAPSTVAVQAQGGESFEGSAATTTAAAEPTQIAPQLPADASAAAGGNQDKVAFAAIHDASPAKHADGGAAEPAPQDAGVPAAGKGGARWQAVVGGVVGAFGGLALATGLFFLLRARGSRRVEAEVKVSQGGSPRKSAGGDVEARGSRGGKRPSSNGGTRVR